MANPWFRLYSEFADDPKVQMMSESFQRRLVMLFCLRCKGKEIETFNEAEIAFQMRLSMEELSQTKSVFMEKGFIDEHWNVVNWDGRQYISDSSTERVRKHRQGAKQDETFQKQGETQNETPPEQIRCRAEQTQKKPSCTELEKAKLDADLQQVNSPHSFKRDPNSWIVGGGFTENGVDWETNDDGVLVAVDHGAAWVQREAIKQIRKGRPPCSPTYNPYSDTRSEQFTPSHHKLDMKYFVLGWTDENGVAWVLLDDNAPMVDGPTSPLPILSRHSPESQSLVDALA